MSLLDRRRQPEWAAAMEQRITDRIGKVMTAVQIDDQDLATFTADIETEVGTLTTEAGNITSAATVLGQYIQQLLANQATPLAAADESAIKTALSDLGTGVSNVGTAVGNLQGLEPPAPTPTPTPAPTPTP